MFSDEAKNLIFNINDYSGSEIKNVFEISSLLNAAITKAQKTKFDDLIFNAKYIRGLKTVLSDRSINGDKYIEKIFEEFNKSLQKFFEQLREFSNTADEKTKIHFDKKYFGMDQESVVNAMELIEDLSLCKEYFNHNPDSFPG